MNEGVVHVCIDTTTEMKFAIKIMSKSVLKRQRAFEKVVKKRKKKEKRYLFIK